MDLRRLHSFHVLKLAFAAAALLGIGTGLTPALAQPNQPPQLAPITDKNINEGSLLVFNASATDPDIPSQTLTFSLDSGAPEGAAISASGLFTWTPSEAQGPGSYTLRVIVTDSGVPSRTDTQSFDVTVQEVNFAPTLGAITNRTVNEGALVTFTANATDPDLPAQTLTFTLGSGAPTGTSIDANTGVFTWTPSELQGPGSYFIGVVVADNGTPNQIDSRGFSVTVQEVNRPPELPVLSDFTVNEGTFIGFGASPNDPDIPAQNVVITLGPGAPIGANISSGGFFSWTPGEAQGPSTNRISIIATDNGSPSLSATQSFTATVVDLNGAPTLDVISDQSVAEDELLTFTASAADPDQPGQTLIYSLGGGAPAGAAIDALTGVFTWTPAEIQGPATNILTVTVADTGAPPLTASRTFTVIVHEVNRPPAIATIEDRAVNSGTPMIVNVIASDPDVPSQGHAYSLGPGAPSGAAISSGGVFTWTPTSAQSPSTNRIAIIVTDNGGPSLSATQNFNAIVTDLNRAPGIAAIPDQTVNEGQELTFVANATDPDQPAQSLTFSLGAGAPEGATIDANTGVFTWTPSELQGPATNFINIVVTDSGSPSLTGSRGVTIVVNEVNRPPELDPIPNQVANVGGFLVFGVVARDPDIPIQTVVLTLAPGAPEGAAISPGGLFTWTPTAAQASTTNAITVVASDGATPSLTATQRFTVTVQGINHAPVMAAIPDQAINEGQLLTFIASATDPEQPLQTLTFSLGAGVPDGATIDPNTGVFTWIPSEIQGPATNFINVIVTDNGTPALTAARGVNVVVNEVNRPPELDPIADQVANVGGFVVFSVVFRDPDIPIQALTATLGPGAPEGAAVSPGGLFTWAPTAAQAPSTNLISVILTDNGVPSLSATQRFTVTVGSINRPPTLEAIPDRTANEGELLTFTAVASDPEQPLQSLTFSLGAGAPDGAVIDPNTGVFTWIPSEIQGPATNFINVIVTDNGTPALTAARGVNVVVNEVNRPPELDPIADQVANVGVFLVFGVVFRDPDIPIQAVTAALGPGAPEGAAISPGGLFTWTPTAAQASSVSIISVIASDGAAPSLTATQHFTVTVGNFNRAPILEAIPDQTINEGELLTFSANASDPEQPFQSLTYTLGPGAPVGASLDPATGVFTWTPLEVHGPETNLLSVVVTDNGTPPLSVAGNVRIVVNEVNRPPFFLPDTNQIVNVGSPLIFNVDADDLDIPRNTLTFTLGPGAPAGTVISARGEFSWRPTAEQGPATNFVTLFVSDGGVPPLRDTNTVRIDVIVGAPLTPPVLREPEWQSSIFTTVIDMIAGRRYSLEGNDSPDQPNWRVVEAFQGRGAPDTMTDRNATNRHRIYRARVE